jgi:hypothetical protein
MRKLLFLLLVISSPCVFAHGSTPIISIPENVVAQGRLINLEISTTTCYMPDIVSAQDIGNGHLELELDVPIRPITMCIPITQSYDLRDYFELPAGEYSLKVIDRSADDGQEPTMLSFVVQTSLFEIVPAMSGSWYDPENPGHGASIEFMQDRKQALVYWYTFDQDKGNLWLYGLGEYDGSQATLELLQVSGGAFPPLFDPDEINQEVWGTLQLDFDDCLGGSMSWTPIDASYSSGEMPLRRISPRNGLPCFDEDESEHVRIGENLFEVNDDLEFEVHLAGSKENIEEGLGWTVTPALLPFGTIGAEGLEVQVNTEFPYQNLNLTVNRGGRFKSNYNSFQKYTAIQVEMIYAVNSQWLCSGQKLDVTLALGEFEPRAIFDESLDSYLFSSTGAVTRIRLGHITPAYSLMDCSSDEWVVRSLLTSGLDVVSHRPPYLTLSFLNRGAGPLDGGQPFYLLSLKIDERNMINEKK